MTFEFVIRHARMRTLAWCGERPREGDIIKHRFAKADETVDCADCQRLIKADEAKAARMRAGLRSIVTEGRARFGESPLYDDLERVYQES